MLLKKKVDKKPLFKKKKIEEQPTKPKFTNIRDIVDKTRPYSMIYSGVESTDYFHTLYDLGIRNFLMSYHYIQTKSLPLKSYRDLGVKFFIDSGAFTYKGNEEFYDKPIEYWERHIINYLSWARANKDIIFAIANLDIEVLVGTEKVLEWNEKYFEPFMLETGIPVCFIWHEETGGMNMWEYYCKRYPYTGISWVSGEDTMQENYGRKLLDVAAKYNTLVHGMGMTRTSLLPKLPFYTSDSSVDGASSILVRDLDKCITERLTIEELYNLWSTQEIQTTNTETKINTEGCNIQVQTVDSNNKVIWGDLKAVVKHKVAKKTIKLKIEGGRELICTTDHSIITMDKEGNLVETKADKLTVGSYVLSPSKFSYTNPLSPVAEVMIQKPNFSKTHGELQIVELSDVYLQFLGLWLGDGCYYSNSQGDLALSCYQDSEHKKVIDTICKLYGAKPSVQPNGIDVKISSVRLRRIMEEFEFLGNSYTKRIPKFVYSLSEHQICQVLKGYFSADGTGSGECSTVSEELKNDIVELLSSLGIYTSTSVKEATTFIQNGKEYNASKIWHINIRDKHSLIIFRDKIGFLPKYKNDKLNELITSLGSSSRKAKRNGIPKELAIKDTIRTSKERTVNINTFGGRIGRHYNDGFNPKVLNSELDFLLIKDIEIVNEGTNEVEVYDLSVDKYERFIANGILVHNTTYLVGVQYGEVNFWRGTKMSRLKKDKWKGEYLSQILALGNLDRKKLLDEEPLEMIKANVLAFIEAEKYIQTRLRTRMYWLRQEAVINKGIHSTEDYLHLLPSADWIRDREEEGLEDYCRNLNINVENTELARLNLEDITIISNWYNPEFEDLLFTSSDLKKIHDKWVNKVVPDDDTRVEDLQNFYLEVVMGRDDSMLKDGSAFTIQAQERDDYIEEDYEELVEIDETEIINSVKNLLPAPSDTDHAPDIEGLDDEIFKERGITVIRDSKGRIVKGSKSMRKSKKIYSEKFPKLLCDTCHAAQGCQHYKAGFVCAFTKLFKKFSTRNKEDVLDALHGMAEMNMERLQRAAFFELVDGGLPTNMVTNLINQNMNLLMTVKSIDEQELSISQTKTTTYKSDGTLQETTSVNATGGGILEELFSNALKSRDNKKDDDDLKDVEIVID